MKLSVLYNAMWLSANQIAQLTQARVVVIEPFDCKLLKPASYVLRLGNAWLLWKDIGESVSIADFEASDSHLERRQAEQLLLNPGQPVLATSLERIQLPSNLMGLLSTLSHVARFGVNVLQGSSFVSPDFGRSAPTALTFELVNSNPNPVWLRSGMPICHIGFQQLLDPGTPNSALQRSVYEAQAVPAPPMYLEEFKQFLTKPNII